MPKTTTEYGRLATAREQILYDLLDEQRKTNELLSQLLPKKETSPVTEEKPKTKTRSKKTTVKEGDK